MKRKVFSILAALAACSMLVACAPGEESQAPSGSTAPAAPEGSEALPEVGE